MKARILKLMNDKQRIEFLAGLVKNCPTASFHFNNEWRPADADAPAMPVGFTIRVLGVCDPMQASGRTFRKCVDALRRKSGDSGEIF